MANDPNDIMTTTSEELDDEQQDRTQKTESSSDSTTMPEGQDTELEQEEKEEAEAIEAIKKYTEEDDLGRVTLSSIIGGDILQSKFSRSLVQWFILVAILMLIYTYNRYQSQQDIITIDNLKTELQEVKYNVLTQSSELMNLSRQSNVEKYLKATNDSMLKNPTTPPYLIRMVEANP
ncbi:MAG: hypothetical protein IKH26_04435 [Bacteroidaceae bacterium]|nr:hypothetical protein [Bacteroidaceae bacterium]